MASMAKPAKHRRDRGLQRVIAVTGIRGLGRMLGIRGQSVQDWTRVPAERVLQIEALTGIPREDIRPDLYGAPRSRPLRRGVNLAA